MLYRNPESGNAIFSLDRFTRHKSVLLAVEILRINSKTKELMDTNYSSTGYQLAELQKKPEGSLGYEFAKFISSHNLDINYLPPTRGKDTHDLWHLVTGFSTNVMAEITLSSFYIGQFNSPLHCVIIGVAFLYGVVKKTEDIPELLERVTHGYTLGKNAKQLFAVEWEKMWDTPLIEIRKSLNLPAIPRTNFNRTFEIDN